MEVGALVGARTVRCELVGPNESLPRVVMLPLVAIEHVQVLDDVLGGWLLRGDSRGLVAESAAGLVVGSHVVAVVPAVVGFLGVEAG